MEFLPLECFQGSNKGAFMRICSPLMNDPAIAAYADWIITEDRHSKAMADSGYKPSRSSRRFSSGKSWACRELLGALRTECVLTKNPEDSISNP